MHFVLLCYACLVSCCCIALFIGHLFSSKHCLSDTIPWLIPGLRCFFPLCEPIWTDLFLGNQRDSFSVVKSCFNCLPLYQIDLQKMPLGKLSKRQIQSAYSILNEVQQVSVMEVFQQVGSLVVVGLEWCEWWAVCVCWRFVLFLHNLRDNRKRVRTSILQGSGGSFFAEM